MGRFWLLAGLLVAAFGATAAACSDDTGAPSGRGDQVTYVDATTQPQAPMADAGEDNSKFDTVDAGYSSAPDGYDPYGICTKCGCPKNTYCFGGGTGFTTFSGDCDAQAPDAFAVGCLPIPSTCEDASCDCLIQAVSQHVACYPDCVQNTRTVYCTNP